MDWLDVNFTIRIPLSEIDFSYARSSGPGGQNVNKVNSKCVLRWNAANSPAISSDVRLRLASRLTQDGELVIQSDRFRDQIRNREDCLQKLADLIRQVATPPKPRKKTRPTRSSERKRREAKSLHSQKKSLRRGPSRDW